MKNSKYLSLKNMYYAEFTALEYALAHKPSILNRIKEVIQSGQLLVFPLFSYLEMVMAATPPPKRKSQGYSRSKSKQLNPQSALDIYQHILSKNQAWMQKRPPAKYRITNLNGSWLGKLPHQNVQATEITW